MTDHPRSRTAGLVVLALAGLAVAVALSIAASTLATQPIGLAGETLRGSERLAPPAETATRATPAARPKRSRSHAKRTTTAKTPTATAVTPPTAATPAPATAATPGRADHDSATERELERRHERHDADDD